MFNLNYGDKNFFEYGCLVDDTNLNDGCEARILYCRPIDGEEDLYVFADCTVNIEDDFIDYDSILDFMGNPKTVDLIQFAIGCIEYYGFVNFASPYDGFNFSRKEIEEKLKYYDIDDNLYITW